jgi:8-oxo-dGTP pyrophosphatase MutT (NUDIX family)
MVAREGPEGLEILVVERSESMRFGAGATVFPGGAVDPADAHVPTRGGEAALARMGSTWGRAAMVAALRELFEETGLSLGAERAVAFEPSSSREEAWKRRFESACTELDLECLVPWARWITPEAEPRRFDTWFFVTTAPAGLPSADGHENLRADWLRPARALAAADEGRIRLMPPTLRSFEELCDLRGTQALLRVALARPLDPILPKYVERSPESALLVLPGDARHELSAAPCDPRPFRWDGRRWRSVSCDEAASGPTG